MITGVEREIYEESGINASRTHAIHAGVKLKDAENIVFIFYATHATNTEVTLSYEHDTSRWVTIAEALNMFEYPLHSELFRYVLDNNITL